MAYGRMMMRGTKGIACGTKIVVGHRLIYFCLLCCTEYEYSETIYHKHKTQWNRKRTERGSTKRIVVGTDDLLDTHWSVTVFYALNKSVCHQYEYAETMYHKDKTPRNRKRIDQKRGLQSERMICWTPTTDLSLFSLCWVRRACVNRSVLNIGSKINLGWKKKKMTGETLTKGLTLLTFDIFHFTFFTLHFILETLVTIWKGEKII